MIRFSFVIVLISAGVSAAATCPFNIPVISLPPPQVAGFSWGPVIRPMADACISRIAVDPAISSDWYAGGPNGLYMTKDSGQTWTKPLIGPLGALALVPGTPPLVYAGLGKQLYLSRDRGANWNIIGNYPYRVSSVHVAAGRLVVGLGWSTHLAPSGVYISNLGGGFATFHPFGRGQTGLIVWTIIHNPLSNALYAGTEIFDHPQPYHPPFFRSTDAGVTWSNVGGALPWHVIATVVRPSDGYLFALTEGAGLHTSADSGTTWQPPASAVGPTVSLIVDPNMPGRLFGGRHKFGGLTGGIFISANSGTTFQAIGLSGVTVGGIALSGSSNKLYAAAYGSGIYVSSMP